MNLIQNHSQRGQMNLIQNQVHLTPLMPPLMPLMTPLNKTAS